MLIGASGLTTRSKKLLGTRTQEPRIQAAQRGLELRKADAETAETAETKLTPQLPTAPPPGEENARGSGESDHVRHGACSVQRASLLARTLPGAPGLTTSNDAIKRWRHRCVLCS